MFNSLSIFALVLAATTQAAPQLSHSSKPVQIGTVLPSNSTTATASVTSATLTSAAQTQTSTFPPAKLSGPPPPVGQVLSNPEVYITAAINNATALAPKPKTAPRLRRQSVSCSELIDLKAEQYANNLGSPTDGYITNPDGSLHRDYHGGTVYCGNVFDGAHAIWGPVFAKWSANLASGAVANFGYPVTDLTTVNVNGIGEIQYALFSASDGIYYTQQYGAHLIYGSINAKYLSLGGIYSAIGVPITDETGEGSFGDRYNLFTNGMLFFTPSNGVVWTYTGPIPTSFTYTFNPMNSGQLTGSTTIQINQNGVLSWKSNVHDNAFASGSNWAEGWIISNINGLTIGAGQSGPVGPNFSPLGNPNDNNIATSVTTELLSQNWYAFVTWTGTSKTFQQNGASAEVEILNAYDTAQSAWSGFALQPVQVVLV